MRQSPVKAIREKCLDCSGGQYKEVELCPIKSCPLYPFRMGKNPYHAKASEKTVQRSGVEVAEENERQ